MGLLVGDTHHHKSMKQAVVAFYRDISQRGAVLLIYNRGDIGDDTNVVATHYAQCGCKLGSYFSAPSRVDDTIGITLTDIGGIRAIATMNLYDTLG